MRLPCPGTQGGSRWDHAYVRENLVFLFRVDYETLPDQRVQRRLGQSGQRRAAHDVPDQQPVIAAHRGVRVIVHPECSHDVVAMADEVGSTDYIIGAVDRAPAGTVIGVGTEIHLVQRLDAEHPDLRVVSLDPLICPCSTMFRIDAAHLCWVLESLVDGVVVNRITVDDDTAAWARVALERMLAIT